MFCVSKMCLMTYSFYFISKIPVMDPGDVAVIKSTLCESVKTEFWSLKSVWVPSGCAVPMLGTQKLEIPGSSRLARVTEVTSSGFIVSYVKSKQELYMTSTSGLHTHARNHTHAPSHVHTLTQSGKCHLLQTQLYSLELRCLPKAAMLKNKKCSCLGAMNKVQKL